MSKNKEPDAGAATSASPSEPDPRELLGSKSEQTNLIQKLRKDLRHSQVLAVFLLISNAFCLWHLWTATRLERTLLDRLARCTQAQQDTNQPHP